MSLSASLVGAHFIFFASVWNSTLVFTLLNINRKDFG
jgi:hypothetical protein